MIIFLEILAIIINSTNSYNNTGFIVWPICTTLPIRHFCCYSDFSRQMSKIWSGPMSRERLHIQIWYQTKFLVPKSTVYIPRFGPDRGPIRMWSGPNWFCKRCQYYLSQIACYVHQGRLKHIKKFHLWHSVLSNVKMFCSIIKYVSNADITCMTPK